jgi:hypothetical protein
MNMRATRTHKLLAAVLGGFLTMSGLAPQALAQKTRFDKLANLPFAEGYRTPEMAQQLKDELLFQQGTQSARRLKAWKLDTGCAKKRQHTMAHCRRGFAGLGGC